MAVEVLNYFGLHEPELEECPFCHRPVDICREEISGYKGSYRYYVACRNKKCTVQPATRKVDDIYRSFEEAVTISINRWNNREVELWVG